MNGQLEFKFYDLFPEQIELPLDYKQPGFQAGASTYTFAIDSQTLSFSDTSYGTSSNITINGDLVLKQDSGWLKNKIGNWLGINYEKR
jgi:hypothetical protein